ncbi:MAG: DUF3786 domain-containing protein [Deltaproteobacteria bacterium]|jgi:hypothetical protein|nr:DUF3786 domain-containing protein [Deltaproteobacteria bacterium]MBW2488831.1 DUF3786 domain-containing protein [Deltaproteobacteria bacterium]MBW2518515.1 DUF3786 domain-containing protein [Deltaproteobacteria bacterium]
MPKPKNAMEIFQLLDKSNCRECGEKTCLAFAGAVYQGKRKISECPKLDSRTVNRFSGPDDDVDNTFVEGADFLEQLKTEIAAADLAEAARRVGAQFANGKLTLKVLGKDFSVDTEGKLYTQIHINPWVAVPFLIYILTGRGLPVSGNWVSFRELKDGKERYALFKKRCEEAMKRVADTYTNLFDDLVHIFSARQVEKQFESDISVVLHPLPRVPLMICYWQPEDGLESSLNVFFDETADKNLNADAVFTLGVGLAQMFTKLSLRHGFDEARSIQ